jgi:mRNA interferase MazF
MARVVTRTPRRGDVYWVRLDPLDRYTAPNENSVPVAAIGREPYSGPRRAGRAKRTQSTSQGLRVSWDIKGGSPWVVGTEIRKTRPAVIVSNDVCNRHGTRVVVLPITSNVSACHPGEVLVTVKDTPGRARGDQIRSIDKLRLQTRVGAVTPDELARIDEALAITLALLPTDR